MHSVTAQCLFLFLKIIVLGFLAMALHEAGHWIAATAVGVKVKAIGLCWKGVYLVRESGPPAKNLLISLAGPLMNVALIAVMWQWSHKFGMANVCFAVCNLLPIRGSDGDRALTCWQEMQKENNPLTENK
jgi:Zn-dependent protease